MIVGLEGLGYTGKMAKVELSSLPSGVEPSMLPPSQRFKKGTIFLAITFLILVGVLGFVFLNKNGNQNVVSQLTNKVKTDLNQTPAPTPFAFEEMTVPYLRSRTYQSSLNELDQYAGGSNYTSYLTSYNSDGLKINGLITKPSGEKPAGGFPAIVFIHGYIPPNQYQTTERYVDYVDYLARNGFVVFKIDLRGHGNSEGEAGGGYYSSDYVIDALNAYAALQSTDFVNPKKIGFWGHSMAGNVTLRVLAAKPEIPAAVIWAGAGFTYTDLGQYRIMDLSYRPQPSDSERQRKRVQMRRLYGDPDPNNWFWKMVIPTNYLSDFKGAIQLDHAVDDATVNVEYSRNLNRILDGTQIPHEIHEYPSGDHNITNPSFTPAMQNTVNFFKKYFDE